MMCVVNNGSYKLLLLLKLMLSGVFRGGGLAPAPSLSADHNFLWWYIWPFY